jgi:heme-degrading monooxygenase HmoA
VSATRFTYARGADLVTVAREARRLARTWPSREGAVGLRTAAQPLRRRTYSLSVWTSHAALRAFLRSPEHVRLVSAHRRRLIASRSVVWEMDAAALGGAWEIGQERLGPAGAGA